MDGPSLSRDVLPVALMANLAVAAIVATLLVRFPWFRRILLTAQRAEVRELEPVLALDVQDLAFVLVPLALVLALPGDPASGPPIGLHFRAEHVLLNLIRVRQRPPDLAARGVDLGFCPGHVTFHGVLLSFD